MTFECMNCPQYIRKQNCVANGKYCPYQPVINEFQGKFEDKVIIQESLREKCLYRELIGPNYFDGDQVDYDIWFKYMISMREVIDSSEGLQESTSDEILHKLGMKKNIV